MAFSGPKSLETPGFPSVFRRFRCVSPAFLARAWPLNEVLWILSETSDGLGQLRLIDQRLQRCVAEWPLPSGRWWAPGLCRAAEGFLLPAAADVRQREGPELWRFVPTAPGKKGVELGEGGESRKFSMYLPAFRAI